MAARSYGLSDRERSLHGREVFRATPSINGTAQCEARRAERLAANKASSRQSTVAEKATPFYTKYVHPVLDAIPETRHVAKAIHTGLMINKGARGAAAAYDQIRSSIGK